MAWKRLLVVFALGVPLIAVLAFGFTREARDIPTPLIGRPAPSFTVRLTDGREVSLADLRGKAVFLNFWASWCPPCRAEARDLEASWRAHERDGDVVFLGINMQDKEEAAREFLREFGVTYANGLDGNRIAISYGIWGIPETFFLDRDGRITYKHVGALGRELIHAKLEEARRGVVSRAEGKGDYRSIQ